MQKFKMKDLSKIKYFQEIEFDSDEKKNEICLSQNKYILDLLTKYEMNECKSVATPLDSSRKLIKPQTINEESKKFPFRE